MLAELVVIASHSIRLVVTLPQPMQAGQQCLCLGLATVALLAGVHHMPAGLPKPQPQALKCVSLALL